MPTLGDALIAYLIWLALVIGSGCALYALQLLIGVSHSDDKIHWTRKMRFWKRIHDIVNGWAWKWARPPGSPEGLALRIDHDHPLWRLNDWCAAGWSDDWIRQSMRLSSLIMEPEQERNRT